MAINGIQGGITPLAETIQSTRVDGSAGAPAPDFGEALANAIGDARSLENTSNEMATKFAAGDPSVGMHETMIAAEKASIGLRYAVTLKNRMLEAYRELMNTPV